MNERGKGDPPLTPLTPTSTYIMEHTCTKKLFIVYLKFKCNWVSCHCVLNPAARQGADRLPPPWKTLLGPGFVLCALSAKISPPLATGMAWHVHCIVHSLHRTHNGRPYPGSSGQPFRAESYFSKRASVFQSIQRLSLPGQSQPSAFYVSHVALGATH